MEFLRSRGRVEEAHAAARTMITLPHPVVEAIGHFESGYALLLNRQFAEAVTEIFFFQAEDGIRDGHVTGVQTWLFRSSGSGVGAIPGPVPGRRRPAGDTRLGRPSAGRRVPRSPDDHRPGIIQCEGEAGARLGAALRYLAGRVPRMGEVGAVKDDGEVREEGPAGTGGASGHGGRERPMPEGCPPCAEEGGTGYAEHRQLLFSIAYRMTG